MAGVPGTDLRSIPDASPISPLMDMEAVEATGGQASDVEGGDELSPEQVQKIMSLIDQIGPDAAIQALEAAASGGGGGPMPAAPGPQGVLSGL